MPWSPQQPHAAAAAAAAAAAPLTQGLGRKAAEDVLKQLIAQAVMLAVRDGACRRVAAVALLALLVLFLMLVVPAGVVLREVADIVELLALVRAQEVGAEDLGGRRGAAWVMWATWQGRVSLLLRGLAHLKVDLNQCGPARKSARFNDGARELLVHAGPLQPRLDHTLVVLAARHRRLEREKSSVQQNKSLSSPAKLLSKSLLIFFCVRCA